MLAAAVLVLVAAAAVVGASWEPDQPVEDPAGVELPEPEDVDDGAADQAPPPDPGHSTSDIAGDAEVSCEPDGCELWRRTPGQGASAVAGSVFVTAELAAGLDGPEGDEGWSVRLHAMSLLDAGPLWEAEVVLATAERGPSSFFLQELGGGDVLLATEQELVSLRADDGAIRWVTELDHELGFVRPLDDEHLLAAHHPPGEDTSRVYTVLSRASGEVSWGAAGWRVITVVGDHVLLVGQDGARMEARDLRTGEVAWSREVVLRLEQAPRRVGDDRVLLALAETLQLLDTTTGEVVTEVGVDLDGIGDVWVAGDAVVVKEGTPGQFDDPQPRRGQAIDLGDPDAEPRELAGLVQAVGLIPAHERVDPWSVPHPTGIALVSQDDERFEVQVLGSDGEVRWSLDGELDEPTCCFQLHAAGDDDRFLVVPPTSDLGPPVILSAADGSERRRIELPDAIDDVERMHVSGDLVIVHPREERRVVIAGEAGFVTVFDGYPRSFGPPVPIVAGPGGVVGIDPGLLLGPELREAAGWHGDG